MVFFSLAEGGFHERSDIVIALMSIPAVRDADVADDVHLPLSYAGFVSLGIIPERFLSHIVRDGSSTPQPPPPPPQLGRESWALVVICFPRHSSTRPP